jgi:predicted RNA methylase
VHPTVKSIALMIHLVKLAGALIPRDEPFRVGDLCVGSGSAAIACQLLGAGFDGAEMCPEAIEIANARLAFWAGIALQALESFILTGDMPGQTAADARQGSLF